MPRAVWVVQDGGAVKVKVWGLLRDLSPATLGAQGAAGDQWREVVQRGGGGAASAAGGRTGGDVEAEEAVELWGRRRWERRIYGARGRRCRAGKKKVR
jgi:hypothetical protein